MALNPSAVETTESPVALNEEKLHQFVGKMVNEMGAAATAPLVLIGDKLGLYRALAKNGPMDARQLAAATNTGERYITEWLASQAASGYIDYDPASKTFSMTPEQVAVFADEHSPYLMTGAYYSMASVYRDEPKLAEAFKTDAGIPWGNHDGCLFCGVAKFFRPGYEANLIQSWIPSLPGVDERLRTGATVADVGCGFGISTIIMARHYPKSRFYGFDLHAQSIDEARKLAASEGVTNITFEVATAKSFPGNDYDLIACFDCLHDMGDPAGAANYIYSKLRDGGSWMIVEPFAHDDLEQNLNPIGRVYYAFSAQVCTPTSLSQEVGAALGAQAGERKLRDIIEPAGFRSVRRATETPFNLILQAVR